MAEQQGGKGGSWFKAIVTSFFGLFSGACLMYLSPLVDKVIKPGKPVANFAYQAQGLKVSFQNRSTGGAEGWWDFGDGSALEPFMADQQSIAHEYEKPGSYAVKLSLRNILGDENERTINVPLDAMAASSAPVIEALEVVPLGPGFAPATFRVVSKVKNTDLCVWALGDELPLDVPTASGNVERLVTFRKPGTHLIKLVAISGKQKAENVKEVRVVAAPAAAAVAVLQVTDEAVPVDKLQRVHNIPVASSGKVLPGNKFSYEREAEPGYHIVKADFGKSPSDKLKNPKLEITSDKRKVKFTGELVKPSFAIVPKTNPTPNVVVEVILAQERHEAAIKRPSEQFEMPVTIPGSTHLPMPKLPDNWIMKQRTLTLKLLDGAKTAWEGQKLPQNETVPIQSRTFRVTATEVGNQVRVDIVDSKRPGPPAGN